MEHYIRVDRLVNILIIKVVVIQWLNVYLVSRIQRVKIRDAMSVLAELLFGVQRVGIRPSVICHVYAPRE